MSAPPTGEAAHTVCQSCGSVLGVHCDWVQLGAGAPSTDAGATPTGCNHAYCSGCMVRLMLTRTPTMRFTCKCHALIKNVTVHQPAVKVVDAADPTVLRDDGPPRDHPAERLEHLHPGIQSLVSRLHQLGKSPPDEGAPKRGLLCVVFPPGTSTGLDGSPGRQTYVGTTELVEGEDNNEPATIAVLQSLGQLLGGTVIEYDAKHMEWPLRDADHEITRTMPVGSLARLATEASLARSLSWLFFWSLTTGARGDPPPFRQATATQTGTDAATATKLTASYMAVNVAMKARVPSVGTPGSCCVQSALDECAQVPRSLYKKLCKVAVSLSRSSTNTAEGFSEWLGGYFVWLMKKAIDSGRYITGIGSDNIANKVRRAMDSYRVATGGQSPTYQQLTAILFYTESFDDVHALLETEQRPWIDVAELKNQVPAVTAETLTEPTVAETAIHRSLRYAFAEEAIKVGATLKAKFGSDWVSTADETEVVDANIPIPLQLRPVGSGEGQTVVPPPPGGFTNFNEGGVRDEAGAGCVWEKVEVGMPIKGDQNSTATCEMVTAQLVKARDLIVGFIEDKAAACRAADDEEGATKWDFCAKVQAELLLVMTGDMAPTSQHIRRVAKKDWDEERQRIAAVFGNFHAANKGMCCTGLKYANLMLDPLLVHVGRAPAAWGFIKAPPNPTQATRFAASYITACFIRMQAGYEAAHEPGTVYDVADMYAWTLEHRASKYAMEKTTLIVMNAYIGMLGLYAVPKGTGTKLDRFEILVALLKTLTPLFVDGNALDYIIAFRVFFLRNARMSPRDLATLAVHGIFGWTTHGKDIWIDEAFENFVEKYRHHQHGKDALNLSDVNHAALFSRVPELNNIKTEHFGEKGAPRPTRTTETTRMSGELKKLCSFFDEHNIFGPGHLRDSAGTAILPNELKDFDGNELTAAAFDGLAKADAKNLEAMRTELRGEPVPPVPRDVWGAAKSKAQLTALQAAWELIHTTTDVDVLAGTVDAGKSPIKASERLWKKKDLEAEIVRYWRDSPQSRPAIAFSVVTCYAKGAGSKPKKIKAALLAICSDARLVSDDDAIARGLELLGTPGKGQGPFVIDTAVECVSKMRKLAMLPTPPFPTPPCDAWNARHHLFDGAADGSDLVGGAASPEAAKARLTKYTVPDRTEGAAAPVPPPAPPPSDRYAPLHPTTVFSARSPPPIPPY
eukprot:m.59489 g.59489  ORF g.59489 m.59489 type:complete len:1191 (+) comp17340_c0_seq2:171-3743(+)